MTRTPVQSRNRRGFTLWELIIVMVIIATLLALAAPSLGGWGRNAKLRDAGNQFLAVTRFARSQAIVDARVYRLNIDSSAGTYWLTMQQGDQFVPLDASSFGQVFTVPSGFVISLIDATPAPAAGSAAMGDANNVDPTAAAPQTTPAIDFQPNGRLQPAHVQITTDIGSALDIAAVLPTDQFKVMTEEELKR